MEGRLKYPTECSTGELVTVVRQLLVGDDSYRRMVPDDVAPVDYFTEFVRRRTPEQLET